jgi:hypothetical protein
MTAKLLQGSIAWFDMVGAEIVKAAGQLGLPRDLRMSLIERYVDGAELDDGLRQGLRIDVIDGVLACRTGVRADETTEVVIEVTAMAARQLNLLPSTDPAYRRRLDEAVSLGTLRVRGDLEPIARVFDMAHDRIVSRTL